MKKTLFFVTFLIILGSCKNPNSPTRNTDNGLEEVRLDEKVSNKDIIRNPVSASGVVDTVNVAKLEFDSTTFNFGKASQGDVLKHSFKFRNTGKVALIVTGVQAQCGCTTPEWNRAPIAPGATSQIDIQFDTKNAINEQVKTITVGANTYPAQTLLKIVGVVTPKK